MKLKKFINECRENEVFKNLSIYIVSSWVLVQVVGLIAEPLGLPQISLTYLLLFLILGFPLYIYLMWRYQIKDRIKKKPLLDDTGNPIPGKYAKSPFQKIYFSSLSIIAIIAVGVVLVVIDTKFVQQRSGLPAMEVSDKIAVLKFENDTGSNKFDNVGKMAADWIIHGITQNKLGQIISPEIIDDYSEVLRASILSAPGEGGSPVTDYLKPSKIVKGIYFLDEDRLIFKSSITDGTMDRTLHSFEDVFCNVDSPLDCIEAAKQKILGYLVTEGKVVLEDTPPNYQAYEYFIDAKQTYRESPHDPKSLEKIELAIEADSNYFEPKVYKFIYYYNIGEYGTADSILQPLLEIRASERQNVLLEIYEALLNIDYNRAHEWQQKEYNIAPLHLETNSNMMLQSLQLLNKPEEIDSVFNEINMADFDLSKCNFCIERYKLKGLADIDRNRFDEVIGSLEGFKEQKDKDFIVLKKILLRAYIRAAKYALADDLLSNINLESSEEAEWMDIYLFAAKEFIWAGKQDLANIYLDNIIEEMSEREPVSDNELYILAESQFYRQDYQSAVKYLEILLQSNPELIDQHALLAIAYYKSGNITKANNKLQELEELRTDYQLGEVDYGLAVFYASVDDEKKTEQHLNRAIRDGHWFETATFHNDPLLKPYFESERFKLILTSRH